VRRGDVRMAGGRGGAQWEERRGEHSDGHLNGRARKAIVSHDDLGVAERDVSRDQKIDLLVTHKADRYSRAVHGDADAGHR
jgi:hypothetical protein